uniref:protocadherin-15-like isoform X2 n=1 Tax=Scatophagus argus TaxID=75038 RepID=UPI001ED7F5CE|nr:protocadherin-15-like isoform X2 [Scatophagus argus]
MHNWQENEIKELLTIRGSEAIRHQITGTVKDSVVYNRMTKLLAERGVYRSHMQVISKLKALRKQYTKYHQQKIRCGSDRVDWPFYEQCHRAFGNSPPLGNPVKRHRSPTPPSAPSPPPPPLPPPPPAPAAINEKHQDVVVSLWDEVDDREINKHLGPVEIDDDEEEYSPSEQLHPIKTTYTVPEEKKRRKTTVMEQVSTLVSATVAQLREMDASMQAQEDARLQRLMDHEKEMQNNLLSQLVAMHERISRENHERHLELVDRILSRFPPSSARPGP